MNSILAIVLCSFYFVSTTIGSYPFFGRCPNPVVVKDFNITKYSGIWYEMEKYFSIADATGSCNTLKYKSNGTAGMTFVKKVHFKMGESTTSQVGKVMFSGSNKNGTSRVTGRLETAIQSRDNKDDYEPNESYWILDTDYGNYSVVWSCVHTGITNFQNVIILTRTRTPTIYTRGLAYGIVKSRGLGTKILVDVDQEECPDLFQKRKSSSNKRKSSAKKRKMVKPVSVSIFK